MILSIQLTGTEYVAVMRSLRRAITPAISGTRYVTEVDALELEHLRTLLAQATVNTDA